MSDWREVIATTRDLKQDYEIIDIMNVTVTDATWKNEAKALNLDIKTGFMESGTIDNLFATASALLRFQADQMGANAVIGAEFDVGTDSSGFFVTGFGTAVRI